VFMGNAVPLKTLQDLKHALIEEWNLIPQCDSVDLYGVCHVDAKL
jgi:hypothetical protein